MAKQGIKTARLAVELKVESGTVIIKHEKRNDKGDFVVVAEKAYDLGKLPKAIQVQVSLYGLNKLLQDRTSQFREHGIETTLAEIENVYATLLGGEWSAKRKASAKAENDDAVLIAVVAESMGKPVAVVAAMFAKLDAAKKKAIAEKFADQVKAAKAEAEEDADEFFGGM